jgi:hypothetical protein
MQRQAPSPPPSPSLEEWRSQYCGAAGIDEDFNTEAEWLELYGEEFGAEAARGQFGAGKAGHFDALPSPALPATTHARLVEESPIAATSRLSGAQRKAVVEALATLERVISREASLEDEAGFWLGSGIPRDLAKVGVKSLGDLVNFINIYGFRWHRRVPRMGVVRARRLLDWLTPIAEAGGRPFKESARRPETDLALLRRRDLAGRGVTNAEPFALVPIVDGALPDALSGRQGAFRSHEANVWGAETDVQAISQWLSRYQGQTRRDYTRIAERFYLWCIHVRRKALSSLQEPDLQAYQAFLAAPPALGTGAQGEARGCLLEAFPGPVGAEQPAPRVHGAGQHVFRHAREGVPASQRHGESRSHPGSAEAEHRRSPVLERASVGLRDGGAT